MASCKNNHAWSMSHDRCMRCRLSMFDLINYNARRGSTMSLRAFRSLMKKAGGAR